MAHTNHTQRLAQTEEALTVLFCLIDDAYALLNARGQTHASLKKLSDSEIITLTLLQQLRGVESERSFLRDTQRFFSHLFPGVVGLHPSSFHRRVRKLRRFLEPLRREILSELVGDPETLLVDSTLLAALHPRQVAQSAGFPGAAWVRWGSFSVYGVKLHLLCATNGVPISYELTPANVAEVRLTEELIAEANLGEDLARRLLGDLAYRSVGSCLGRMRDLSGDTQGRPARPEAAHRDRAFDSQAGVRSRGDAGDDPGGACEQDRGEDLRLHLRLSRQSPPGSSSRAHQGVVGVNLATDI